jgi:hypothetical protein
VLGVGEDGHRRGRSFASSSRSLTKSWKWPGNLPRGTVLRIIQDNPQIVEVAWDGERTPSQTPELSQALRLIPQEES